MMDCNISSTPNLR